MATTGRSVLAAACGALALAFVAMPQGCVGHDGPNASFDAGPDAGPDAGWDAGGDDAGVFVLLPHARFEAISGEPFTTPTGLETIGGQRPFAWAIERTDETLAWLGISDAGVLFGTAGSPALDAGFTVAVTDARARTARQDFVFAVTGCPEGDVASCDPQPVAGVCTVGQKVCLGGLYGTCDRSSPTSSPFVAYCGPTCAPCNPTGANMCDGVCMCQGQPECDAGLTCCSTVLAGDKCRDVQSDPEHCGTCDNDCTAANLANTLPTCSGGGCEYPCVEPYARCDVGSPDCPNDLDTEVANCGACGNLCRSPGGTGSGVPICVTGTCDVQCDASSSKCGSPPDCQAKTDRLNCGGCGILCPVSPAHVDGGTTCDGTACRATCERLWDNCDDDWGNGCEKSVAADTANCGSCGHTCDVANGDFCQNGLCCSHCLDVDGNPSSVDCCGTKVCNICEDLVHGTQYPCCTGA